MTGRRSLPFDLSIGAAPRYPNLEWAFARGYSKYAGAAGWASFDRLFAQWAERNGYRLDYFAQDDLGLHPGILDGYQTVVMVGHDEYHTREERMAIDTFIESDGHLARFAGNQIWQARREDDRLVCYKAAAEKADPLRNNPQRRHLLTSIWESKGVDWPPAKTWGGANGVRGFYAKLGGFSPRASGGLTVYREILNSHSARHVVMIGESAGGGLIMTSVLRMRQEGLPMPAALGLLSPWADISKTGTSLYDLANGGDPIIDWDRNLVASAKLYAGDTALKDPAVSPL